MSKKIVLAASLALASASALALTETVIITETMPDGTVISRTVEYREIPSSVPDISFAAADRNGDGRINWQEAHDMGILRGTFNRLAGKKGYLTPQEYEAAMMLP